MSDEEEKQDPVEWMEEATKRNSDMKFDVRVRLANMCKWGGASWLDRREPEEKPEDLS